jgi:2-polyprenyl-3-methyl-5-hydroxy-6-metoxy-1,4-benzoquinol methylase
MKQAYSEQSAYLCRGCASDFVTDLLNLPGFPKAAQYFLETAESTEFDVPATLQIAECQDCGLVQLKNTPVAYYKDVITAAAISEKSRKTLLLEWSPIIERYSLVGKKALEIGAGRGDFLKVLDILGLQAWGLENSASNVSQATSQGLMVRQGYVTEVEFECAADLIVCNNYLEHQPDIKLFLRKIKNNLTNDGIVYFSVPNIEYLLERSCLYEFVADHLVYFDKTSLRNTFENNGFDVVKQYSKNNNNDLVLIAKRAIRHNLTNHLESMNDVIHSLQRLLNDAANQGKSVVAWGAGHRALALMALADAKSIRYIVDSAEFKQNLFAPITHIPIKSPEYLIKNGCDILLLLLPGNFAMQVTDFLNNSSVNCRVIVFDDKQIDDII